MNKWNFNKIQNSLDENGYYEFKNYLNKKEISLIENTLIETLHYIKKSKEKNLQKKYYEIKKYNNKLKSHWYDLAPHNIDLLKTLHKKEMINFVKKYFNSKVVFSGRPAIHVHDNANDKLLDAHQETNQFARDTIVLWVPIYNTNEKTGGLCIYKNSHKNGYFKHYLKHSETNKKLWTKKYTHIRSRYLDKFDQKELKVNAGNAIIFLSSLVHKGYENSDKNAVRITITERFNPLKKVPFLKKNNVPMKIPYIGVNLNKIKI
mgnify:FL=1